MILIYTSTPSKRNRIDNSIEMLKDRFSVFFVDDKDFIISSESNPNLLRGIFLTHKISLLYTHSIRELLFSSKEISELIKFLLSNGNDGKGGYFYSESDNLTLSKDNIGIVESTVSEICRRPN